MALCLAYGSDKKNAARNCGLVYVGSLACIACCLRTSQGSSVGTFISGLISFLRQRGKPCGAFNWLSLTGDNQKNIVANGFYLHRMIRKVQSLDAPKSWCRRLCDGLWHLPFLLAFTCATAPKKCTKSFNESWCKVHFVIASACSSLSKNCIKCLNEQFPQVSVTSQPTMNVAHDASIDQMKIVVSGRTLSGESDASTAAPDEGHEDEQMQDDDSVGSSDAVEAFPQDPNSGSHLASLNSQGRYASHVDEESVNPRETIRSSIDPQLEQASQVVAECMNSREPICSFIDPFDSADKEDYILMCKRHIKWIPECIICQEKLIEVLFLPCGHFATCIECGPRLRKCPQCRAKICGAQRVFMP